MAAQSNITGSSLGRREPCAKCGLPVFLAERLNVGTKLYHRTCFRCARCNNQLSLANCYETETDDVYCCETCPDEEEPNTKIPKFDSLDNVKSITSDNGLQKVEKIEDKSNIIVRNRSLSDEEKSRGLQQFDEDEYSADFENTLEKTNDKLYEDDSLLSRARSNFLSSHLLHEENQNDLDSEIKIEELSDEHEENIEEYIQENAQQNYKNQEELKIEEREETPPPLPQSKPPDILATIHLSSQEDAQNLTAELKDQLDETTEEEKCEDVIEDPQNLVPELSASVANSQTVNTPEIVNISDKEYESKLASEATLAEDNLTENNITKDITKSLVKSRMMIFETKNSVCKDFSDKISDVPLKKEENISKEEDIDEITVKEDGTDSMDNYKTVRSDFNTSDVSTYCSVIPDSPPKKNEETENKILTESLLEDLSFEQSEVSLSTSLFDDTNKDYPKDLNPFGDDNEDVEEISHTLKKIIKPSMEDLTVITPLTKEKRKSTNPFGSSDEENEDNEDQAVVVKQKPPRPPLPAIRVNEPVRKVVGAPRISLNPFWSDEEAQAEEEKSTKPIPLPRSKHLGTPEPKPRRTSGLSNAASHYDSNSSLSSVNSSINSSIGHTPGRKKKPAPLPPSVTPQGSKQSSPSTSTHPSPKLTPRVKKTKKAPLPPTSTPLMSQQCLGDNINVSTINDSKFSKTELKSDAEESVMLSPESSLASSDLEKEKISKDEKNRNRQSQNLTSPVLSDSDSMSVSQNSLSDKSTHGKWKRKKGPAPARPVPQRRQIKPLPLAELRRELDIIELQQQGLEKQGVKLEQLIREKCEIPGCPDDAALSPEVEELVLELFELVNEKNELFRRQAELMYLRRQQRLEEEHADLEYQIRCLMERPERNKTDSDKAREEELINRLLEVVERRNEIVECLEMDRVREAEEDQSINSRLNQFASKKDEDQNKLESPVKLSKKEKKKIKKEKKLKEKGKNLDADKDIDETEHAVNIAKEKKKKKWF